MECHLCRRPRLLRDSHIVPEFLYSPAYDAKHRVGLVAKGESQMRLLQKGIREPLLCDGCEEHLNTRYEQPMSKIWSSLLPEELDREMFLLEGLDYETFKLFHLSILWRASVASGPVWESVSLGPKHEENLRRAIRDGNAPPRGSYPLLATIFLGPDTRRPCFGWVMAPCQNRLEAATIYSSLYGGCAWHIVVASHATVDAKNPFVLSEGGQLGVPAYDVMQLPKVDIGKQVRFRWPTG